MWSLYTSESSRLRFMWSPFNKVQMSSIQKVHTFDEFICTGNRQNHLIILFLTKRSSFKTILLITFYKKNIFKVANFISKQKKEKLDSENFLPQRTECRNLNNSLQKSRLFILLNRFFWQFSSFFMASF